MFARSNLHRENRIRHGNRMKLTPNPDTPRRNTAPSAMWLVKEMRSHLVDPLNTMLITTRLLDTARYGTINPRQSLAIQRIESSVQRIVMLLDELTTYVKAQSGEHELEVTDFSPAQLLDQITRECQPYAEAKELAFETIIPDDFPSMLRGDPASIRAIILPVVWNAIGLTATGSVQITSEWDGKTSNSGSSGNWCITIRDTGPGISDDVVERLFEPFQRGMTSSTTVPTSGNGMGLAIAYALTQVMSGQLMLTQTADEGTTFGLCIPLQIKNTKR
jgi:signal transduction histidine kinase